jgi:hypothetical protein
VKHATKKLIWRRRWLSTSFQTHWSSTCKESPSILKWWKMSNIMINLTSQICLT